MSIASLLRLVFETYSMVKKNIILITGHNVFVGFENYYHGVNRLFFYHNLLDR